MRGTSLLRILLLGICLLLPAVSTAEGQTSSGTLQGSVSDPTGQAVPLAKVKAQATETGLTRETVTEESGFYVINFLPVGTYLVTVEVRGFKTARIPNVLLEIGQTR